MEKTNCVLFAINSKYIHSCLAPWYLAASARQLCGDKAAVHVVEGTVNEPLESLAGRIISQQPNVIGFSCYIWNITVIKRLLPLIKSALPDAVIVLGGPEVSYNAAEVFARMPLADYIICGEGEQPFAQLLLSIAEGKPADGIAGLCFKNEGKLCISPPNIAAEDPPSPYDENYFAALNGRIAYLETSRGCPFSCAFCLSGRCGGVRFFDLQRSKQNLLKLANSDSKTIKLVDRTFNANRARAYELFSFIIENSKNNISQGVCFHFEIAGDLLDDATLELLAQAPRGLIQFEIGLQSFNEQTLSAIDRKTDLDRLKANVQKLVAPRNIHVHIDLIAGLPYEDLESFKSSFNTAYSLSPDMLQFGFLKLLHGSPMRTQPQKFECEFEAEPPYQIKSTPWLSHEDIGSLKLMEDMFDRLYNSGRFTSTLSYMLAVTKLPPFELFRSAAMHFSGTNFSKIPLDDFTSLIYGFFSKQQNTDTAALRDAMTEDRLATNSSGMLPEVLKVKDSSLKSYIMAAEALYPRGKSVKRAYAILYSQNCLCFCDYKNKCPVTGRYELKKLPLPALKRTPL